MHDRLAVSFTVLDGSGRKYSLSPSPETVGRIYLDMPEAERDVFFDEFTGVAKKIESDMLLEQQRQQTIRDVKLKADAAAEAAIDAQVADFKAKLILKQIEGEKASPGIAERLANFAGFVSPTRARPS